MEKLKSIPELSLDSRLLHQRLQKCSQGDFVSYEELNELIGGDVQNKAYPNLVTAKKRAQRIDGLVFFPIRGSGLKCLDDDEIVAASQAGIDHIRRHSKRNASKLTCVDYGNLSADEKITHNLNLSYFAAIQQVSKNKTLQNSRERIAIEDNAVAAKKMIEVFKEYI